MGGRTNGIPPKIEEKIESFVEGDLEHAAEMVSALWKVFVKDGDVQPPSSNATPVSPPRPFPPLMQTLNPHDQVVQVKSPARWDAVKIALISSIRTGVIFGGKYWARHSHARDMLKPVYFSSTIMKDKAPELNDCASG